MTFMSVEFKGHSRRPHAVLDLSYEDGYF